MTLRTPKTQSTRLSVPCCLEGDEPADAAVGTLSYAIDTETLRVKIASGWVDVTAGSGTVSSVTGSNGIVTANPTGPTVTVSPTYGSAANTITQGNDSRLSDSRTPTGSAGGDLGGTYPNPTVTQARGLKSATTTIAVSAATAPTTGQVLTATGASAATWQTPASSGVTTVAAGTGISVASPTGPTATVSTNFGTSSTTSCVGDDARLSDDRTASGLRTASTVVSISASTAPTAGQALIASSTTLAAWTTLGSTYSLRDSIWDPPTTPSADDDEFTVDGLASGVWKIWADATPIVTLYTRAGTIDMTATLSANTFRSAVVGSTLFVQVPQSVLVVMAKQYAGALSNKQLWWAAFAGSGDSSVVTGNNNDPRQSIVFWKDLAGVPDPNNRAQVRHVTNGDHWEVITSGGGTTNNAGTTINGIAMYTNGAGARIDHGSSASSNFNGFTWSRNGQLSTLGLGQCTQYNASTNWYGFMFGSNSSTNGLDGAGKSALFAFHFIRRTAFATCTGIAQP